MRLNPNNIVLLICSLMITFSAASLTVAQNESDDPSTTSRQTEDERLAEMLANRQEQLNQRLENLRRTEKSMGENHPSLQKVRTQINELEKEIESWSSPRESALDMSDRDLRALVLQLGIRVDRLEERIGTIRPVGPQNRPRSSRPGRRSF